MFRPGPRADALVFALTLLGVGYFHQGGGWNQNSRFAMVRAIVEDGSLFIDNYLVYERGKGDAASGPLRRLPIHDGNVDRDGTGYALAWRSHGGELLPVDPEMAGVRRLAAVEDLAATGDVAYARGHFHPNKAPGTTFAAVPAYALLHTVERVMGVSPDTWAALTLNAWLTSLLSVGLATALAAVLVLRLARRFGSEVDARLAALSFGFATMAWPYGTFLFEHNIIAACLVAALYAIETALDTGSGDAAPPWRLHFAGLAAGYAAITNYTTAVFVVVFAVYLLARMRSLKPVVWFGLGVLWPLAAILAYNVACFGTPFTTNYAYESTLFVTRNQFLGVFALPQPDVVVALLFSPFRGLFFTSPLLLAAVFAAERMLREGRLRAQVALILVVTTLLLLINASFNGWDGGWTAVPRYLGPGMGLLVLPLAYAFGRWRAVTLGLAAVSFVIQLLLVAVDPEVPIGDVGTAGIDVASVFRIDPMTRYVVPLFISGHAWPLLDEAIEQSVARATRLAQSRGEAAADIQRKADGLRSDLRSRVEKSEPVPLSLATVVGPVSANPIGICEGYYNQVFPAFSVEAQGNSFNVGESIFPGSRLSLLPLFLLGGALATMLFQHDDDEPVPAPAPAPPATRPAGGRKR